MKTYDELSINKKIMIKEWIMTGVDQVTVRIYASVSIYGWRYAIVLYLIQLEHLRKQYGLPEATK